MNKSVDKKVKERRRGFFYEWITPIIIAGVVSILIKVFVAYKVVIPSESMVPTLNVDDRLFVTRIYNLEKLERGDIIVFHYDQEGEDIRMIKRLIGLPGDNVEIVEGKVSVNGTPLEENYIGTPDNYTGTFEVPEGKYFFLGDNRKLSKDSRYWPITPFVDGEDIEAKAQIKVRPLSEFGLIK